jgi:hypothetical protein
MRKQQVSILSFLQVDDLRSCKDLKGAFDEFTEIQPKLYSEIESNP